MIRIGLISDTHGLLRPEVVTFLVGCDHIVHAGDIGKREIVAELARLAPFTVVRGNNDVGEWATAIPDVETLRVDSVNLHVLHERPLLAIDPRAAGIDVVVSGHSHKPAIEQLDCVWFVNPGSAGPRRFKLPIACGELIIDGCRIDARIVEF